MRRILLLILVLVTVKGCQKSNDSNNFSTLYSSTSMQEERENINWNDLLNQKEEDYYAFIHSETCYYCKKIEKEINEFATLKKTYFISFSEEIPISSERGELKGTDDINSLYILGTPTLFHITNKKVEDCLIGLNEIQAYIKEVLELIENKDLI